MHKLLIGLVTVVTIVCVLYFMQTEQVAAPEVNDPILETTGDMGTTTESLETTPLGTATQKFVSTAKKPAVDSAPVLPTTAFVIYDGKKFLPNKVTIIKGGTVKFMNVSDDKMWIASDNHPIHSLYPEKGRDDCAGSSFDQCEWVKMGGSWNFTFTKVGTWTYHNHEHTTHDARVTVMTEEDYLEKFYNQ